MKKRGNSKTNFPKRKKRENLNWIFQKGKNEKTIFEKNINKSKRIKKNRNKGNVSSK